MKKSEFKNLIKEVISEISNEEGSAKLKTNKSKIQSKYNLSSKEINKFLQTASAIMWNYSSTKKEEVKIYDDFDVAESLVEKNLLVNKGNNIYGFTKLGKQEWSNYHNVQ